MGLGDGHKEDELLSRAESRTRGADELFRFPLFRRRGLEDPAAEADSSSDDSGTSSCQCGMCVGSGNFTGSGCVVEECTDLADASRSSACGSPVEGRKGGGTSRSGLLIFSNSGWDTAEEGGGSPAAISGAYTGAEVGADDTIESGIATARPEESGISVEEDGGGGRAVRGGRTGREIPCGPAELESCCAEKSAGSAGAELGW